jgi:hypothetical protein
MSNSKNITFAGGVDIGPINVMANGGYDHGVDLMHTVSAKSKMCWDDVEGALSSRRVWMYAP